MTTKKVKIMCGLPGSGKSRYANTLEKFIRFYGGPDGSFTIFSADHYFQFGDEYRFDAKLLPQAHQECLRRFARTIVNPLLDVQANATCVVVVDNTNICRWEYQPYYALAEAFGWEVELVEVGTRTDAALIAEYAKRNVHGVSIQAINGMLIRWENALPWQKVVKVP